MDLVDPRSATSAGDNNKRRVGRKSRNWRRRLHLRKTAVQPPAMQGGDKPGPKEIAEEWERSSKKPRQDAPPRSRCASILRFTCSQCQDDSSEYAPRDLTRHFVEKHRGSPPVFSCHLCNFSTNEFSYLQVHLLGHEDTFSSCGICNDDVQRSWSEFSAHLSANHCPNGKYSCEMCQKFSTGDVEVFLEHLYGHSLDPEEAGGGGGGGVDASPLKKDNRFSTAQTLRCQYCDFEASRKFLITKHTNAVHVCKNGNRRKGKRDVRSIAGKPSEALPRTKARLTRSAVKDMCWLAQDCLSLPGREFLDKYCHLSDPQTTLEETQQFLMQSVAGETHEQKWTKALKTVLSNVPKDVNLHSRLENGIMSSQSDLAVLRVKNKITLAQNGATYSKRLKMMTSTDKDAVSPEGAVAGGGGDAHCAVNHGGCESNLKDPTARPEVGNDVLADVSGSVQSEPSQCARMQENRENQDLKTDQDTEEHNNKKPDGPAHADGKHISGILNLAMEGEETAPVRRALPRRGGRRRRRKRKGRFRKAVKGSEGETLKIVLKKNPVEGRRWVSQSSLDGELNPHTANEDATQTLESVQPTDVDQRNVNTGSTTEPLEASVTSAPESDPVEDATLSCSVKAVEPEDVTGGEEPDALRAVPPGPSQVVLESVMGDGSSGLAANQRAASLATEVETDHHDEEVPLQQSHAAAAAAACRVIDDATSGATPRSGGGGGGGGESSPVSPTALTPHDELNMEDSRPERPAGPMSDGEAPADSCRDLRRELSPAAPGRDWKPAPKRRERTLKLVAASPSQRVKRPAGDQPVVVLNHPDADSPQVAKIMEVVHRYREVRKVVLSRRTLNALGGPSGGPAWRGGGGGGGTPVRERFTLKLKLRRLSRKKYEIVAAAAAGPDGVQVGSRFPCWFCGRTFPGQEVMLAHRRRHLMEWKRPKCENS